MDAEGTTIVEVLTTATTTVVNDCMDAIAAILPIIIPLVGAGLTIAFVVKFVKRISGKA